MLLSLLRQVTYCRAYLFYRTLLLSHFKQKHLSFEVFKVDSTPILINPLHHANKSLANQVRHKAATNDFSEVRIVDFTLHFFILRIESLGQSHTGHRLYLAHQVVHKSVGVHFLISLFKEL